MSQPLTPLEELAMCCEKSTGPDRELDLAIVYALHPDIGPYQGQCVGDDPIFWHEPYRKQPAPGFTGSIDSAMTLVPEGYAWTVSTHGLGPTFRYWCSVGFPDEDCASYQWASVTPAIALCAAALRARAALSRKDQPHDR